MSVSNLNCLDTAVRYTGLMPKLWNETIEA
jgi:hypothetical protein